MQMILEPKMVECKCGNQFEANLHKSWCQKCCRPVFYHKKDQRNHLISHSYLIGAMMMVFMFVVYIFIEMIATPLISR
jgi:hypothetical protein